jgi:hypothetical protein
MSLCIALTPTQRVFRAHCARHRTFPLKLNHRTDAEIGQQRAACGDSNVGTSVQDSMEGRVRC